MTDHTCSNCAHWDRGNQWDGYADCLLISDDPTLDQSRPAISTDRALISPFAGADGGCLWARADFGCVLFAPAHKETL